MSLFVFQYFGHDTLSTHNNLQNKHLLFYKLSF